MAGRTGRKTTTAKAEKTEEKILAQEAEKAVEKEAEKVKAEPKEDKKDKEIENLKAQIEQLKELVAQQAAHPQQIVVTADNSERVWFLWMADVADDNQILIGENGQYGRIIGKTGTFYVPKNDISRIMDAAMRYYLANRWVIVVSGLTDEEREALGVKYKEGEILDEKAFRKIVEIGRNILDIFPGLCKAHKEMVASIYYDAYMTDGNVEKDIVVALNKMYPCEAFKNIISLINEKEIK